MRLSLLFFFLSYSFSYAIDTLSVGKPTTYSISSAESIFIMSVSTYTTIEINMEPGDSIFIYNREKTSPTDTLIYDASNIQEAVMERGYCYCEVCLPFIPSVFNLKLEKEFTLVNKSKKPKSIKVTPKGNFFQSDVPSKKIEEKGLRKLKLNEGNTIELDKIFFIGGSTQYLDISLPQLQELLEIMNQNKNLVIQIEGHVNGLYNDTTFYNQLSQGRANAIRMYLIRNNINSRRIKTIGFGNTRMLFPKPRTDFEMLRNRRVEVRILSN